MHSYSKKILMKPKRLGDKLNCLVESSYSHWIKMDPLHFQENATQNTSFILKLTRTLSHFLFQLSHTSTLRAAHSAAQWMEPRHGFSHHFLLSFELTNKQTIANNPRIHIDILRSALAGLLAQRLITVNKNKTIRAQSVLAGVRSPHLTPAN